MTQNHQPDHQSNARPFRRTRHTGMRTGSPAFFRTRCVAFLLVLTLLAAMSGCAGDDNQKTSVADYGRYGANLASQIAAAWPNRSAGSRQETETGNYLINELKALGYTPDVATFSFYDRSGLYQSSRNISITVQGLGFITDPEEDKPAEKLDRQVIIGAHYDAWFSEEEVRMFEATAVPAETTAETASGIVAEPKPGDYDGIHDNASGIGALMTLAKLLRQEKLGYDVVLVAFGAGEAEQAGAKAYVAEMSDAVILRTDVMYCIDSIYAGDKVYAHAGRNSLLSGFHKDYEKRRKLYEVTDVFYEYELYTNNNYMLYTNQASFDVTMAGMPSRYIYREWSLTDSDYLPFDEQGIPIVFFESYNYEGKSLVDLKESSSPVFSTTMGAIRHTFYDSSLFLKRHYSQVEQSLETEATETSETVETGAGGTADPLNETSAETGPDGETTGSGDVEGTTNGSETDAELSSDPSETGSETDQLTGTSESDETGESDATSESEPKKVIVDLLTKRINNTSFIILEAIRKGVPKATVQSDRP